MIGRAVRIGMVLMMVPSGFAMGCAAEEESGYWLFPDADSAYNSMVALPEGAQPFMTPDPVRTLRLEEIGEISHARIWNDTLVGIVDGLACQFVLIDIAGPEPRYLRRFGTCGEGPGEFRRLADGHIHGDTLIAIDAQGNLATFFAVPAGDADGARVLRFAEAPNDPWTAHELLAADSASLLVLSTLPGAGISAGTGMLRLIDREDGSLTATRVPDARVPASNPGAQPRRISACWDDATNRLVVANRWRVERAILDVSAEALLHRLVSDLPWVDRVERMDGRPGFVPAAFVRLGCGQGKALLKWRGGTRTDHADRFYMELIGTDGSILRQEHGWLTGEDHPAAMGIIGPSHDGWLLYSNTGPTGPALHVFGIPEPN